MKTTLWEKEKGSHGHSVGWIIFEEDGKIFVDSHVGWISEAYLNEQGEVKIHPVNPVPNYVKVKLKSILKSKRKEKVNNGYHKSCSHS